MRNRTWARTVATAGVLLGLMGCSSYGPELGVGVAYADRGPPAYRREYRGDRPGDGMVWMGGYWRWVGRGYDWVPGRWVNVQSGYRSWSPGRWRHSRQGWYWREGRWR